MTKKLLLSKHQQVQLLEAASILVGMHEPEEYENFASSPTPETLHFTNSFDTLNHFAVQSHSNTTTDRSYLISEYPPSLIPSTYSPMPGYVGGYLDVPKKRDVTPEDETDHETRPQQSPDPAGDSSDDEDEEILGKME